MVFAASCPIVLTVHGFQNSLEMSFPGTSGIPLAKSAISLRCLCYCAVVFPLQADSNLSAHPTSGDLLVIGVAIVLAPEHKGKKHLISPTSLSMPTSVPLIKSCQTHKDRHRQHKII